MFARRTTFSTATPCGRLLSLESLTLPGTPVAPGACTRGETAQQRLERRLRSRVPISFPGLSASWQTPPESGGPPGRLWPESQATRTLRRCRRTPAAQVRESHGVAPVTARPSQVLDGPPTGAQQAGESIVREPLPGRPSPCMPEEHRRLQDRSMPNRGDLKRSRRESTDPRPAPTHLGWLIPGADHWRQSPEPSPDRGGPQGYIVRLRLRSRRRELSPPGCRGRRTAIP